MRKNFPSLMIGFFVRFSHDIVKSYRAICSAGVLLLGVALLALEAGIPLVAFEHEAKNLQYQFEEKASVSLFEADCEALRAWRAECRYAQYRLANSRANARLLEKIVTISLRGGAFLLFFSLVSYFLARPIAGDPQTGREGPEDKM